MINAKGPEKLSAPGPVLVFGSLDHTSLSTELSCIIQIDIRIRGEATFDLLLSLC